MNSKSWQNMLKFLEDTAENLRNLESKASDNLYTLGDEEAYKHLQFQKTDVLIDLPNRAQKLLEPLEPELQSLVTKGLRAFADEAARAKRVNSVFYMSVLLYPDEVENSSPQAFDLFVEKMRHKVAD